jgi:predicted MFS family arabinose efflux permease
MTDIAIFLMGVMVGFVFGYPIGLFIDYLDKKEKSKDVR